MALANCRSERTASRIGGAAIDTWWDYPPSAAPRDPSTAWPFHRLDNVLLSPHVAGWTTGTVRRRTLEMARNLDRLARGDRLVDALAELAAMTGLGQFALLRDDIRRAQGDSALAVEHVGSTSVPGLLAKPILDICLVVQDPPVESTYVPALRTIGYVLQIREPGWYEHRMLWHDDPASHLHVFSADCVEVERVAERVRHHDRPGARGDQRCHGGGIG